MIITDKYTLTRMNYLLSISKSICMYAARQLYINEDVDRDALLNSILSTRCHIKTMRGISAKMTVPMSTAVKQQFCKKCSLFMFCNLTCSYEIIYNQRSTFYLRICQGCGHNKKWRLSHDFNQWRPFNSGPINSTHADI